MKVSLVGWKNLQSEANFRKVTSNDVEALGLVMYDAYQGTVDYSGETIDEATAEICETLNAKYGPLISGASLLACEDEIAISAVLFTYFEEHQMPLLTFAMTKSSHKGQGIGKRLLNSGLASLADQGYSECCLYFTHGNEPAISIYRAMGFKECST